MVKGWADLSTVSQMSRTEILDQNDWLDALEEAEDSAREKAEAERNRKKA